MDSSEKLRKAHQHQARLQGAWEALEAQSKSPEWVSYKGCRTEDEARWLKLGGDLEECRRLYSDDEATSIAAHSLILSAEQPGAAGLLRTDAVAALTTEDLMHHVKMTMASRSMREVADLVVALLANRSAGALTVEFGPTAGVALWTTVQVRYGRS